MAKVFFRKTGVHRVITNSKGVPFKFEVLGDANGVLALDAEKDKEQIADLDKFIERKIGGVGRIDEAAYESLKKNLPLTKPQQVSSVKVFDPAALNRSVLQPKASAPPATAPAGARPAAVLSRAIPVAEAERLAEKGPVVTELPDPAKPKGRQVRLGPAKPKAETPAAPPTA